MNWTKDWPKEGGWFWGFGRHKNFLDRFTKLAYYFVKVARVGDKLFYYDVLNEVFLVEDRDDIKFAPVIFPEVE